MLLVQENTADIFKSTFHMFLIILQDQILYDFDSLAGQNNYLILNQKIKLFIKIFKCDLLFDQVIK